MLWKPLFPPLHDDILPARTSPALWYACRRLILRLFLLVRLVRRLWETRPTPQHIPVCYIYVSIESVRRWLGSESFARYKCIFSPTDTHDKSSCKASVKHGDNFQDAWLGVGLFPVTLRIGGSYELEDGRCLVR